MNFEIRANRSRCSIKRRGVRRLRFLNRVTPVFSVSRRDPINPPAKCPLIRFPTRHHLDSDSPLSTTTSSSVHATRIYAAFTTVLGAYYADTWSYLSPTCP